MTAANTPLDVPQLSPEAQRALSNSAAKAMAAKGLAPFSNPVDLVSVLYQLTFDNDEKLRQAAAKSASELPDRVVLGALSDRRTDPRVLDFFARRLRDRYELLEALVLNNSVADYTLTWLAGQGQSKIVDLIASNEQRLLSCPQIIGAMYVNREARMSVVDRVVELAVRNDVKVPGIAAWDEIVRSLMQSGHGEVEEAKSDEEKDELFAKAARVNERRNDDDDDVQEVELEPTSKTIRDLSVPMKMRLATLGNKFDRAILIRDTKKMVAMAAIKSPGVQESEAAKYAGNQSLVEDVIAYISNKREWVKQYGVKLSLVQNPKTPLPAAMRLMTHLREKDVASIARSKGVPSALAAQAKKLNAQKTRGNQ